MIILWGVVSIDNINGMNSADNEDKDSGDREASYIEHVIREIKYPQNNAEMDYPHTVNISGLTFVCQGAYNFEGIHILYQGVVNECTYIRFMVTFKFFNEKNKWYRLNIEKYRKFNCRYELVQYVFILPKEVKLCPYVELDRIKFISSVIEKLGGIIDDFNKSD
jgi:hypothetical protein